MVDISVDLEGDHFHKMNEKGIGLEITSFLTEHSYKIRVKTSLKPLY